jgi:acetyl-CoA carboxylase biotin carboxyl carrier protein
MNQKELKELIEFLIEKDIAEFELERGDMKVRIKRTADPIVAPQERYVTVPAAAPSTPVPETRGAGGATGAPTTPPESGALEEGLYQVNSPIVGTFYESPSPGSPAFVKVGDSVEVGQVLCIIEAMKLMNEIESDVAGEIVKSYVSNGQPVEYGQVLFSIRPRG